MKYKVHSQAYSCQGFMITFPIEEYTSLEEALNKLTELDSRGFATRLEIDDEA